MVETSGSLRPFLAVTLTTLLLAGLSGCAGSDYYAQDRDKDRTDYVNRMRCPGEQLPVCFERGGEIVSCRCVNDFELDKIVL